MKEALTTLAALGGGAAALAAVRAALKSYRAKKKTGDIVADAVEAAIDTLDHKK